MTSMMTQLHRVVRIYRCGASAPDRRLVWVGEASFGVRWPVFGSLDYIYVPAADVDGEALRYVQTLGAELVWKVRGMGTTVACLRVGESGPAILLSGHLRGQGAILVYRVQDYAATVAQLRARLPASDMHGSRKVDGEFTMLVVDLGEDEAFTVNPGGARGDGFAMARRAGARRGGSGSAWLPPAADAARG